jgi:hypothetical protein
VRALARQHGSLLINDETHTFSAGPVAILSDSMAARYRDRLTALTIDDVETPVLLALIWRSTHSPAVRELLVHSRPAFAKPASGKNQPAATELPM